MTTLPPGFNYLQDPRIICQIKYHGSDNFIGRPITGYNKPLCIGTDRLLSALSQVQDDLDSLNHNLVLKVFEAYRPAIATNDFVQWAADPNDIQNKVQYYPNLEKLQLFEQGYILKQSVHSRGGAVDLTIVEVNPSNPSEHTELDMGTIFDFFGEESNTEYRDLSPQARANRQFLRLLMEKNGFKNYPQEWWHYNIINEEFPDTYFDFPIE